MLSVARSAFASVAIAACLAAPAATAGPTAPAAGQGKAATFGLEVVEIPAEYRQHTGYAGSGVFVAGVLPNSPAEAARILPGDVLSALGNAPLPTTSAFYALTSAAGAGTPISVAVTRYGRALKLTVTPADVDTFFAAPAPCRLGEADGLMTDSIAAGRRHDPAAEAGAAQRALDLYESCASVNAALDEHVVMKAGDALLSQAVAAVSQGDRAAAEPFANNAIAMYALATRSGFVSESNKTIVRAKIDAIERAFPEARNGPADGSITLGLRSVAESGTAAAFSVLSAWSAQAGDTNVILHVRLDLHPEREAHLFVQGFKITINARYIGPQAIYALNQPPAETSSGLLRAKSDVDPHEDFRIARRVDLGPGDHKVYVLSFLIPSDSEFSDAAATIAYAPR
jgi:membrane-associated protease RseP (regulator of RpoE activity)